MKVIAFALACAVVPGATAVTLDTLMETPLLRLEPVVKAEGAALLELGAGLASAELEGKPAARWEAKDAAVTLRREMRSGKWRLRVYCQAPNGSTDSLWVSLDGAQEPTPLTLPTTVAKWAEFGLSIATAGEHEVKLTLRESAGAVMGALELARVSVAPEAPAVRPEVARQRPRLYLTPETVAGLAERAAACEALYKPGGAPGEKLRDYETEGKDMGWVRSLPNAALAYLLSHDPALLARVKAQVLNAVSFPHWANPKFGRFTDVDLDAEYAMEGVALCYDWLYDEWTEAERALIRDRIALACDRIFAASLGGRTGGGHDYQQNHFWFPHYALALGAAAVLGEAPEAEEWLAWSWDRLERVLVTLGPDGGFHEHAGYWDFSTTPLFQWIDLYEDLTGRGIPVGDECLRQTATYRFHNVFPGWQRSAALGDAPKTMGPGLLTNYMWLAQRYGDPVVWGMADLIGKPGSSPWHLLYAEPAAPRRDPLKELPVAHHFTDIETVFARTDWTPEATMVAFICRPMGGKLWWNLAHRYGLNAVGHNHPDANHFILFGRGEVLCVDPGYTYTKLTGEHNTVLVDGLGQYGDGEMWPRMNDGWGEIEAFRSENGVTYVRGNATRQYRPEAGLTRFVRELELRSRDEAVIRDELAAAEPRTFTWLLHHEGELRQLGPDEFEMTKGKAKLGVRVRCEQPHQARLGTIEPNYEHTLRSVRPEESPVLGQLAIDIGPTQEAQVTVELSIGDA